MINQQTNTGIVVQSRDAASNWLLPPGSIAYNHLATTLQQVLVPVGAVVPYTSTTLPTGYLPCDGSVVNISTYPGLFSVIGNTYGPGDTTQFSKFTPNMSSDSQAGFITSASSTLGGFNPYFAFNGSTSGNPWAANSVSTGTLQVQAPSNQIVTAYSVCGIGGATDYLQAPRDWTLQGSMNGSTWTTLDTRVNEMDWFSGEKRYYVIASPRSFLYHRINVTANNGSTTLSIQELELYTQISSSFTLPDFRGRAAIGRGVGTGLTNRAQGTKMGLENVTLTVSQIPSHTHGWNVNSGNVSADHSHSLTMWTTGVASFGSVFNALSTPSVGFGGNTTLNTDGQSADHSHSFSSTTDSGTGSGGSHNNMQPSLVVNFAVKF